MLLRRSSRLLTGLALCWVLFLGVFVSAHAIGHGLSGAGDQQVCGVCALLLEPTPTPSAPLTFAAPLLAAPQFVPPASPAGVLRPAPVALRFGRAPPALSRA